MNPIKQLFQKLPFKIVNSHSRYDDPARGMYPVGRSLFSQLNSDAFSSSFPSIRAISNEYMTVRPYAVDENGDKVKKNPIIDALYHPNQLDSSVSFFEKIAVSTLSLRKTYILVWRLEGKQSLPGGDFTKPSTRIAGFTFLEFPSVKRVDGKTYYEVGLQKYSEREVLVLPGGVNPYNLYGGYSPSEAARRWAKLDDYIADFQAGFFENGAVPAGQFLITAATTKDYNDIVNMLEERHRGAGKNGNVTYSHRPIDPENGKPAEAQIEWIPFAQKNKDIDFNNLFKQVNNRIDVSFGASQFIKGVDDAPNYATAQVSDKNFAKRAVYPLLLRNYTQLTHELNRITNGMGMAITFDYEIPTVSDEEKVKEETSMIRDSRFLKLKAQGYTVVAIKRYFDTGDLEELERDVQGEDDNTDVDEGDEVTTTPDPKKVGELSLVNKGAAKSKNPKAKLSNKQKLEKIARKYLRSQVDRAIEELEESSDNLAEPTEDELQTFVDEALLVIIAIMIENGEVSYEDGKTLLFEAGLSTENLDEFILSDAARDSYQGYLRKVGQSYGDDTAKSIRKVLTDASENGLTLDETKKALRNIMDTDEYRVLRLATTELGRSSSLASVEAMKQIQNESGATLEKSLSHSNEPECEWCKALEDVWFMVDQPLLGLGESLEGVDGGILINDFVSNDGYDVHPNGKGNMVFRVVTE